MNPHVFLRWILKQASEDEDPVKDMDSSQLDSDVKEEPPDTWTSPDPEQSVAGKFVMPWGKTELANLSAGIDVIGLQIKKKCSFYMGVPKHAKPHTVP